MRRPLVLGILCVASGGAQDLREAARLDGEGKCVAAEPIYRQALARGPLTVALLNNAGNHYLLCRQPERARQLWARLLTLSPGHANATLQLARLALAARIQRAESLYRTGRRPAAVAELDAIAKEAAADPVAQFALGAAFAKLELFERAETVFQGVLRHAPADFDALLNFGRAAARAQHYDRARTALESAVRIRPGDADALLELGLAAAASKDATRAVYLLAQAGQAAPQRPDIALALARASEDAGFYGDSALAYDRYLALRPADRFARRDRARVLAASGARLAEGLREMSAYVREHPADPAGHYNLAQFTWKTAPERSLALLAEAIRLDPKFSPAHVSRAWLLHRLGRSAEAIPHLQAALRIAPRNVRALDQLGLAYLALGRAAEAEKALGRAAGLDAGDLDVRLHWGRALMALGREAEAQPLLESYRQAGRPRQRDPRLEPGMIESATLPEGERRSREIDRFERLAKARPDDATLLLNHASLLLADGRLDAAEQEFEKLLTRNIDAAIARQAGQALLRAERFALSARFLKRAEARVELAAATLALAGPEAALEALGEGAGGDFVLMRARLLHAAGRREEAGRMLTEGLRSASIRPEIAVQAALMLLREGRDKEALALTAGSDHAELRLLYAALLGLDGRTIEAEKRFGEIQARWPEWERPYLLHGVLLRDGARAGEAQQKIRIAVALGAKEPCAASLREFLLGACELQRDAQPLP